MAYLAIPNYHYTPCSCSKIIWSSQIYQDGFNKETSYFHFISNHCGCVQSFLFLWGHSNNCRLANGGCAFSSRDVILDSFSLYGPRNFLLSVSTIGWQLALWRLGTSFALSLTAGYITHYLVQKNLLGQPILKTYNSRSLKTTWTLLKDGILKIKKLFKQANARIALVNLPVSNYDKIYHTSTYQPGISIKKDELTIRPLQTSKKKSSCGCSTNHSTPTFKQRLIKESYLATVMVAKFMILAFFLEAVITLYVPADWIIVLLGQNNPFAIFIAALIGVPIYTSNLAALGMIGGLLNQGMSSAAALAFLIAGPTTTIPAMAAVWNLVSRKIFLLYVSFTLTGAIFFGYFYYMITSLI